MLRKSDTAVILSFTKKGAKTDTLELDLMDVIDCACASIIHILAIPAEND